MEHGSTGSLRRLRSQRYAGGSARSKGRGGCSRKQAGHALKSAAEHLRSHLPDDGMAGQVADRLTSGINQAATQLQEQGFGGMIDDVVAIARRYPMQTLFIGLGCGYLWTRLHRD